VLLKLRGEIYLLSGALLFSFNGIISKIVLVDGLSAWRLTQIRTGGAFVILFAIYFTFRRSELKTNRRELPWLIAFGVVGVALVQAFYFVAIERLYVGVALLIEFTAPIWILLFKEACSKFSLVCHLAKFYRAASNHSGLVRYRPG